MPVLTIECQLSQVQLKRYLAGEELPEALLQDLQAHLQKCPECMAEAHRKRAELAGEPVPDAKPKRRNFAPKAAVEVTEEANANPAPSGRLAFDFRKNGKTLALSGGLALVLIVMSTLMNDPTRLLGPKASESPLAASAPTPPAEAPPAEADATAPIVMDEDPTPAPVDVAAKADEAQSAPAPVPTAGPPVTAGAAAASRPSPEVRETPAMQDSDIIVAETGRPPARVQAPARPRPAQPRQRASAPRRSDTGSIRVYDENGRPKN